MKTYSQVIPNAISLACMITKRVYTRRLNDQELRRHLEHGDTITFSDTVKDWEEIERQVERLGFGSDYAVSRGSRPLLTGLERHTRVTPLRPRA